MKRIAVLGSGPVGQALADGFLKHGHEVMRASREPGKIAVGSWNALAQAIYNSCGIDVWNRS